jgi:hypothetical protein
LRVSIMQSPLKYIWSRAMPAPGPLRLVVARPRAHAGVGVHVDGIGRIALVRLLAHQAGEYGEVVRWLRKLPYHPSVRSPSESQRDAVLVEEPR